MLDPISDVGLDASSGGYRRFAWTDADMELREWFVGEAEARGMDVVEDGNGNQLAWLGSVARRAPARLTSRLRAGRRRLRRTAGRRVVFAALDRLRANGFTPTRPIVVANFADEEGARFGIACAGSQLATGVLAADRALALKDRDDSRWPKRSPSEVATRTRLVASTGSTTSARSSSCTSSRDDTSCTPATRWASPARSGRTAGGGSTSTAWPTTRARRGWPTGVTR